MVEVISSNLCSVDIGGHIGTRAFAEWCRFISQMGDVLPETIYH